MRHRFIQLIFLSALIISALRLRDTSWAKIGISFEKLDRWEELARFEPEEIKSSDLRRYRFLSKALEGVSEAGYFSEAGKPVIYGATRPNAIVYIRRYYRAQFVLIPTVLRYDRQLPLVVVDCSDPTSAERVLESRKFVTVRDFGGGLVLARPASGGH